MTEKRYDAIKTGLDFIRWYDNPSTFFKELFKLTAYSYQHIIMMDLRHGVDRMLLCAASGTGKTKLLAAIALWFAVVKSKMEDRPYHVIIVSGSRDQAKYLYNYCREALLEHPYLSSLIEGKSLLSLTRFKDGSVIRALSRSLTSVQGKHGDVMLIDEASLPELDFFLQDSYRVIGTSPDPHLIFSSTPHAYDSRFVYMWENKRKYPDYDKDIPGTWKRHFWTAMDCPGITADMMKEASGLPQDVFERYWMGKPFPMLGTMIPLDLVREASEYPRFTADKNQETIMGVDWGFGRKKDVCVVTIIQVIDNIRRILIAEPFKERHPDEIVSWILEQYKTYNVGRIYTDAQNKSENMRLVSKGVRVIPVAFNQQKNAMKANLRMLFEQKQIQIPEDFINLRHQLSRYTWNTDTNDDYVDSLMLAVKESATMLSSDDKPYLIFKLQRNRRKDFPI